MRVMVAAPLFDAISAIHVMEATCPHKSKNLNSSGIFVVDRWNPQG
jgi:hypothetical protein